MSVATRILEECQLLSQRLSVNPVIDDDVPCMAIVASISHNIFVREVLYIHFKESVKVFGAHYFTAITIGTCNAVVDDVQAKDIRVGDTVYLGLDKELRVGVVGVDLTRRPAGATAFVCLPEHRFPVDLADYD